MAPFGLVTNGRRGTACPFGAMAPFGLVTNGHPRPALLVPWHPLPRSRTVARAGVGGWPLTTCPFGAMAPYGLVTNGRVGGLPLTTCPFGAMAPFAQVTNGHPRPAAAAGRRPGGAPARPLVGQGPGCPASPPRNRRPAYDVRRTDRHGTHRPRPGGAARRTSPGPRDVPRPRDLAALARCGRHREVHQPVVRGRGPTAGRWRRPCGPRRRRPAPRPSAPRGAVLGSRRSRPAAR